MCRNNQHLLSVCCHSQVRMLRAWAGIKDRNTYLYKCLVHMYAHVCCIYMYSGNTCGLYFILFSYSLCFHKLFGMGLVP